MVSIMELRLYGYRVMGLGLRLGLGLLSVAGCTIASLFKHETIACVIFLMEPSLALYHFWCYTIPSLDFR